MAPLLSFQFNYRLNLFLKTLDMTAISPYFDKVNFDCLQMIATKGTKEHKPFVLFAPLAAIFHLYD
jgi:hypothetical protein